MFKRICFALLLAVIGFSCQDLTSEILKKACNDGLGECVAFNRCSNATQFSDGLGFLNIRFGEEDEQACHYLEMCCDPEDVIAVKEKLGVDESPAGIDESIADINFLSITEASDIRVESETETTVTSCIEKCQQGIKTSPEIVTETVEVANNMENTCDGELNECVPFYMCANSTYTDGSGALNSRFTDKCSEDSHICCDKSDNLENSVPIRCGLRNKNGVAFRVENLESEAQFGEMPWVIALTESKDSDFKYFCGGSLIDPYVVLTSAHCVSGKLPENLRARAGEWDTQTTREPFPHADHAVRHIMIRDDFGPANLFNDIALLILETPVKLSAHINTICLPPQNYKFDRSTCIGTGWGADKFEQRGAYRVNLKKVQLPIVPAKECQDSLRTTKLGARFKLDSSFLCAGGMKDVDTCTGDGGSPLICPIAENPDFYFQSGITAWGIECGREKIPGVYAKVSKYRNWIDQQMNNLGFGTKSYSF